MVDIWRVILMTVIREVNNNQETVMYQKTDQAFNNTSVDSCRFDRLFCRLNLLACIVLEVLEWIDLTQVVDDSNVPSGSGNSFQAARIIPAFVIFLQRVVEKGSLHA